MQRNILVIACIFTLGGAHTASCIDLGTAATYAVLADSTVTNTGPTILNGDLGLHDGTSITGFFGTTANEGPGNVVGGTVQQTTAAAMQAQTDATSAFNALGALIVLVANNLTGQNLGDLMLVAGNYEFNTSAQLTGDLVLDGPGEYVFKIGSTLTTASLSSIVFINGASPLNVFFRVGDSATLGTGTMFGGTIISLNSNTLTTGATVLGRVIALEGAVTLDTNTITVPEPASFSLLALGGLAFLRRHRAA